jgi:hypothetical protein
MSETGWAAFLGNHIAEESPLERSSRLARQAAEQQDRAELADEAERTAAVQERHELMELAALQAGMAGRSAEDVFRDAGRLGDEDAEYSEAQRTIARIDKRRETRRQQMADQAQRMTEITGLASRSATVTGGPDLLAEAKQAHREFAAATRAKLSAAVTGTPRQPRPKEHGGRAVRSELECWYCVENNVDHDTSTLLHLDPRLRVPITTLEQAIAAEQAEHAEHAERRQYASYAEISR